MKAKIFRTIKICAVVAVLAVVGWSAYEIQYYLRTSPRFDVKQLAVSGERRVGENEIIAQADFEIGGNVFAADLDEMRERVERFQWVRHALVQRVLPDRIMIKVIEREPIGVARMRGEIFQFDEDAAILDPDPITMASFPVLDGLVKDDEAGNRKKVGIYRQVLEELGQSEISEVHVNNSGEVSVVSSNDPLLVSIGTVEFRSRWIKYLQLRNQIEQQYPEAVRVDLRFRNQVIVSMTRDDAGEKVIWDAGKKSL